MDIKNQTHARAFNPCLRAKSDNLKKLIEEVQTQIEGYEAYYQTRKRARRTADKVTFERMIEALVCDLCLVQRDPQYHAVHLPLSHKVLRKASRYKSQVLSKTLLFPHLTVDRIVKAYAKLRQRHPELRNTVFHSTRKWFITQCERTGVPEHYTASLVGHHTARSSNKLTYALYSAGISDAQKRGIIDGIRLPDVEGMS